jgi:hypothetical protein
MPTIPRALASVPRSTASSGSRFESLGHRLPWRPVRATTIPRARRAQPSDVRQPGEAPGLQLPRELRDHVEAAGLRGSVEGAGERRLDLVFAGFRAGGIAPRLPHAGVNTLDFGPTRIVNPACFLDRSRILGCQPGFRFRRRKA